MTTKKLNQESVKVTSSTINTSNNSINLKKNNQMETTNQTLIFESYNDFLNRQDKSINGVSKEFANANPDYKKHNQTNTGCWNCTSCTNCKDCISCNYCTNCVSCNCCIYCNDCVYCNNCVRSKWLQYRTDYIDNRLDKEKYNEAYNSFCDVLDDCYGSIKICGYEYTASNILDQIHPRDFDMYLLDYIEELENELQTA